VPKKLVFGFLLCFCFDAALACSDDELRVVKSSNLKKYYIGQCLNKNTVLQLEKGECVTLQHKTALPKQKKCGKYSSLIEKILKLITQNPIKDSYCEFLDMGKIQNFVFCVIRSPFQLFFYRKNASFVESFTIVDGENNKSQTYEWLQGKKKFPWPVEQFPIKKGINYSIKTQVGQLEPIRFRKESIPNSDDDYWVLDWGCLHKSDGIEATVGPIKPFSLNKLRD